MFPASMFSMKMYPIDTVNCFPVLPEETLVVGYMRQDVADLAEDTDQTVHTTIFMVGSQRVNPAKKTLKCKKNHCTTSNTNDSH